MDVRPKTSTLFAKILLLLFALIMVGIYLLKAPLTSGVSRGQGERIFEDAIPKDVPIKVKIKKEKEKSFKDLKDGNWVRNFELELTNTGNKPIYFLYLTLVSDVEVDGQRLVFPLVYGRVELGDIISKAQPDDIPIKPGETHLFKIHPGQVPAWEQSIREKSHQEARRLRPELQSLSFGDGTGYFGNHPYPERDKPQSKLLERSRPDTGPPRPRAWPSDKLGMQPITFSMDTPVNFLPANFFGSESSKGISLTSAAPLVDGCLFPECTGIIPYNAVVCYDCPPQNRPTFYSGGLCRELRYDRIDCFVEGEKFYCQTI